MNVVSQEEERTLSVHKEHEFLSKMEAAGLNNELAQRVVQSKNNRLAKKVVRFIKSGGVEPSTSQKHTREIMGKNFFGVEEAIKHFGINPTNRQLAMLSEIPFSESVLQELKNSHILVAVFPISILEIRKKVDSKLFYNQDWYSDQEFAKEKGELGWQLIRKTPVENSTSKNWQEQLALIPEEDEVPTAQVMVYTIAGHYLATNERLFENVYVRTSSLDSGGSRVDIGSFGSGGLRVPRYWDVGCICHLGLVSSRKS